MQCHTYNIQREKEHDFVHKYMNQGYSTHNTFVYTFLYSSITENPSASSSVLFVVHEAIMCLN